MKINSLEPNGIYEEKYPNGQLYISCNMKNGKYDGIFIGYDENGTLCKLVHYKNGVAIYDK